MKNIQRCLVQRRESTNIQFTIIINKNLLSVTEFLIETTKNLT